MNKHLTNVESMGNLIMLIMLHIFYFTFSIYIINRAEIYISIPLFVLASFIHQKFLAELLHEGCHFHLQKNKSMNEFISNFFVGLFFFVTVKNYRKKHFKHHEFETFFKDDDPETAPLKISDKKEFWKNIFFDLTGINGIKFLINYTSADSEKLKFKIDIVFFIFLLIQLSIFISSIIYEFYVFYLIYYFGLGTFYHLQLRFRILCQHVFLNKNQKINYSKTTSRTIKGGILEKLFFTSDITAFHDVHHDHPQYPFRKCRKTFLEKKPSNDKNIFSKTRSDIILNYYKSLA